MRFTDFRLHITYVSYLDFTHIGDNMKKNQKRVKSKLPKNREIKNTTTLSTDEIAHPYATRRRVKSALYGLERADIENFGKMFSSDEAAIDKMKKNAERERSENKEKLKASNKIIYKKIRIAAQKRKKNPKKKRKPEYVDLRTILL